MTGAWHAWAAGLFEGEGSISVTYPRTNGRANARIQVNMTDADVMLRFASVVGGYVLGPYDRGTDRKPVYVCQLNGFAHVRRLFEMFEPYLGERRRARFREVLALEPASRGGHHMRDKTHCKRGHPLQGENVYVRKDRSGRECRVCSRLRQAEARKAAARGR